MLNFKKLIITLIIIIFILIAILTIYIYVNRGKVIYKIDESGDEIQYDLDEKLRLVTVRNDFYIVKNCVNQFYSYYIAIFNTKEIYNNLDDAMIKDVQKQNAETVYDILDVQYIKDKAITKENILTKLEKIKTSTIDIKNMYISEKTDNISIYIVEGTLRENNTNKIGKFKVIVKIDSLNRTFSIIPQDFVEKNYNDLQIGDNIDIEIPENIEENTNNQYIYRPISDETYITDLINQHKLECLYETELVYNRLDEEYRSKRFETLDKFQKYIKDNQEKYKFIKIQKYKKNISDDYTEYICVDSNGNNYIFRESSVMKYTLLLDTYTIDLSEFIEKYDNGTDKTKVELNIGKIVEAVNNKDYEYIYNQLDEEFKNNNFKTKDILENYIKSNFYDKNNINIDKYEKQNDIYIYDLTLKNAKNELQTKSLKIVLKLEENRNFVMSFSM